MTWVYRQQPRHECAPPTTGTIPAIGAAGNIGDLWRCECGRLWRITDANQGTRGHVIHGKTWRPATLWQRLRYAGATGKAHTEPPWPETERYPFLEEGRFVNGQHYRRGPGGWEPAPRPSPKFLKPAPRRTIGIQLSRDVDSTRSIQAQETALRAAEPEHS